MNQSAPLAFKIRPQNIKDVVGQSHLLNPGQPIYRMIQAKQIPSMILYGPPGIGKTTIANAIAGSLNLPFYSFNASTDTKKQLSEAAKASEKQQIVLLVDEIHRLDKIKQDFLLSFMESGQIIVIGATTENPYINVTPALRSRSQIYELKPLNQTELKQVLAKGIQELGAKIDPDAIKLLTSITNGDVRGMLNMLEISADSSPNKHVTLKDVEQLSQRKLLAADKDGDSHYDVISAFQKSIRGSDTDAALHYAARIILAGDLPIIVRRLTVIAYEDIGLADPQAAQMAIAAINTALRIGLPEARIPLAHAIILLCNAPKSNSGESAIDNAIEDIKNNDSLSIPDHLKDSHYKGSAALGHGINYKYAHDYPNDWVAQQYLPDQIMNHRYYYPKSTSKYETHLGHTYMTLKKLQYNQLQNEPKKPS